MPRVFCEQLGLNLGMDDIISQIHPKVALILTLAFGPAPLFSEFHFQDKQNAEKLGVSFRPCSFTQPYALPPQTPAVQLSHPPAHPITPHSRL